MSRRCHYSNPGVGGPHLPSFAVALGEGGGGAGKRATSWSSGLALMVTAWPGKGVFTAFGLPRIRQL